MFHEIVVKLLIPEPPEESPYGSMIWGSKIPNKYLDRERSRKTHAIVPYVSVAIQQFLQSLRDA